MTNKDFLKELWQPYNDNLQEIYSILDDEEKLYSLNSMYDIKQQPSKKYRAVYRISNKNYEKLANLINETRAIFWKNCETLKAKNPRLPDNLPNFFDNSSVFKMQVHINKAHQSTNYKDSFLRLLVRNGHKDTAAVDRQEFEALAKSLDIKGIKSKIDTSTDQTKMYFYLDIKSLCEVYQCDSIQYRIATGRQIRADYFTKDDKKLIEKSFMKSIGVLLLPPTHYIDVMLSHERKIRTDALYIKDNKKEIIIEELEPYRQKIGRLYRRYADDKS